MKTGYASLAFAFAILVAASAQAVILSTDTATEAHSCCLPNGSSLASGSVTVIVKIQDAAPNLIGTRAIVAAEATDHCDFSGNTVYSSGPITVEILASNTTFIFNNGVGLLRCPFGLRSKSIVALIPPSGEPIMDQAFSQCSQPCYDCSSLPFEE